MKNKLLRSKNCLILCCFVFMCFAFSTLTHPGQKTQEKKKEEDTQPVGMMKIRIRLVNRDNVSFFDQEKVLTAQKNEMKISLGAFKKIKNGEYDFLIDAVDMFTGKEDNFHRKVKVR